jgi:hypothetical protein
MGEQIPPHLYLFPPHLKKNLIKSDACEAVVRSRDVPMLCVFNCLMQGEGFSGLLMRNDNFQAIPHLFYG